MPENKPRPGVSKANALPNVSFWSPTNSELGSSYCLFPNQITIFGKWISPLISKVKKNQKRLVFIAYCLPSFSNPSKEVKNSEILFST